ncbi:MAG: hypothetical protein ACJ8H8_26510 [Geminicoccaceae bacterium]
MDRLPHLGPQPLGALDDGLETFAPMPRFLSDHRSLSAEVGERMTQSDVFDDSLLVSVRHGGTKTPEVRNSSAHADPG